MDKDSYLQLEVAGWLRARAISQRPLQPPLAIRCVVGGSGADEGPQVGLELLGGRETAHTQGEQNPSSGVGRLGGVRGQLLADLAVDLVPESVQIFSQRRPLYLLSLYNLFTCKLTFSLVTAQHCRC